jgi:hypothetical protein
MRAIRHLGGKGGVGHFGETARKLLLRWPVRVGTGCGAGMGCEGINETGAMARDTASDLPDMKE